MSEQKLSVSTGEPDPARRPARMSLYAGAALLVAGAVVLYIGYDGAATNPLPQAQTPYVISGGLLGLGLLALGGIAIALHVILTVQADFRTELDAMRRSIETVAEVLTRDVVATSHSNNGTVMIAEGGSSFHRAECRLVERAEHVRPVAREQADRDGLLPCRICRP